MWYTIRVIILFYIVLCYLGNAYFLNMWTRYCREINSKQKYGINYSEKDCMMSLAFSPFCFPVNIIWCVLYYGTDKCFFKMRNTVRFQKPKELDEV